MDKIDWFVSFIPIHSFETLPCYCSCCCCVVRITAQLSFAVVFQIPKNMKRNYALRSICVIDLLNQTRTQMSRMNGNVWGDFAKKWVIDGCAINICAILVWVAPRWLMNKVRNVDSMSAAPISKSNLLILSLSTMAGPGHDHFRSFDRRDIFLDCFFYNFSEKKNSSKISKSKTWRQVPKFCHDNGSMR